MQVADFVAGSLARCFDADFRTEERTDFLAALDPVLAGITHWPHSHANQSPLRNLKSEGIHPVIYEHSLRAAGRFLESAEDNRSPSIPSGRTLSASSAVRPSATCPYRSSEYVALKASRSQPRYGETMGVQLTMLHSESIFRGVRRGGTSSADYVDGI